MAVVKDLFVNALELSEGVVGALLAAPTPVKISIVLVVGYFVFYMRRFAGRRHVRSKASLKGKTVIITGEDTKFIWRWEIRFHSAHERSVKKCSFSCCRYI